MAENESGDESPLNCARMLKVLADETRLDVVRLLMGRPHHVGDLAETLRVEQSLMSHHLRQLREAGLVVTERDGKSVLYKLSSEAEQRRNGNVLNLGCCKISFDV